MDTVFIIGFLEGFIKILGVVLVVLVLFGLFGLANTRVDSESPIPPPRRKWTLSSPFPYKESSRKVIREHNAKHYPDDKPQAFYSDRR